MSRLKTLAALQSQYPMIAAQLAEAYALGRQDGLAPPAHDWPTAEEVCEQVYELGWRPNCDAQHTEITKWWNDLTSGATHAAPGTYLRLSPYEVQCGHDRVRWAEGLIRQLHPRHEGRNSWLLNYGTKLEDKEAEDRRNVVRQFEVSFQILGNGDDRRVRLYILGPEGECELALTGHSEEATQVGADFIAACDRKRVGQNAEYLVVNSSVQRESPQTLHKDCANSIVYTMYDDEGKRNGGGVRTSFDTSGDSHIMSSALELVYADRRGVVISDADFSRLIRKVSRGAPADPQAHVVRGGVYTPTGTKVLGKHIDLTDGGSRLALKITEPLEPAEHYIVTPVKLSIDWPTHLMQSL